MSTGNLTQQAIDALKSGNMNVDVAENGETLEQSTDVPEITQEEGTDESDSILDLLADVGGENNVDDQSTEESTENEGESDDSSVLDALEEGEATEATSAPAEDVEFIKAADKRIKIDYTNRKRIKQAFAAEAGMRKFQRERDEERARNKVLAEQAENYQKLDTIYQERGATGVIEQLEGRTMDEIVQERIDRLILKEENPAKAAQLEYEDKLAEEKRQRELLQKQMEEVTASTRAEREAAEEAKLESMIQPVFTKYSFAGKLGDPDAEHQMDEALWNQAFARLEQYPEDMEVTPAMIRKEFRTVANTFGKIIKKQVKAKTQEATKAKQKAAKENVQAAVASGNMANSDKAAFARKFRSGDMTGSLIDLMTGKVKL